MVLSGLKWSQIQSMVRPWTLMLKNKILQKIIEVRNCKKDIRFQYPS